MSLRKRVDNMAIDRPVTPAMHRGWAPNIEKTKEAMKEQSRTSDTPYCPVTTVKCKENAIPGRTLGTLLVKRRVNGERREAGCGCERKSPEKKKGTHLAKRIRAVAGRTL